MTQALSAQRRTTSSSCPSSVYDDPLLNCGRNNSWAPQVEALCRTKLKNLEKDELDR